MKNLPIQSAPVQRGRLAPAVQSPSAGVSPSVCVGVGPFQACLGPFLNEGGVGPSGVTHNGVYVAPFGQD